MQWSEFILALDCIRSAIRAKHNPKAQVPAEVEEISNILALITRVTEQSQVENVIVRSQDDIPVSLITEVAHPEKLTRALEVGDVKGAVLPRETPRVRRAPQLEEIPADDNSWKE